MSTTCFLSYTPYHVLGQSSIASNNDDNILFCVGDYFDRDIIPAARSSDTFSYVYHIQNNSKSRILQTTKSRILQTNLSKKENSEEILNKMDEFTIDRIIVGHDKRVESQAVFEKSNDSITCCYSEDGEAVYSSRTNTRSRKDHLVRKLIHGRFIENTKAHGCNSNIDVLYATYPKHIRSELKNLKTKRLFDHPHTNNIDFVKEYQQRIDFSDIRNTNAIVILPLYSSNSKSVNNLSEQTLCALQNTFSEIVIKPHPREEDIGYIKRKYESALIRRDIPIELVYLSSSFEPEVIVGPSSTALYTANLFLEKPSVFCLQTEAELDDSLERFYNQVGINIIKNGKMAEGLLA